MALPISVTYTFATATSAIPLSQLDANFTTVVNGINGIGNGTNALANVLITGGTIDNVAVGTTTSSTGRFSTITATTGNITTVNATTLNAATHRSDSSLTFQTNGTTTAMTVDTSQNVGIGTTSPSAKLSVSDTANPKINLLVGSVERVFINYTTSTTVASFDSDGDITLSPNNTEAIRVNAFGNVGIGTSSPGAKLEIATTNQSMKITGSGAANWTTVANTSRSFNYGVDATGFNIYDNTAASYRMVIDSSGNVGIGQTPTGTYKLEVNGNMAGGFLNVFGTGTPANGINNVTTNALGFFTNSTERARIDSGGNAVFGNSGAASNTPTTGMCLMQNGGTIGSIGIGHATGTATGNTYLHFCYNGSSIGNVTQNGTTAVSYNTSSDYRLKTAVQPMTSGLATVAALKPVTYKWNADDSIGEGFIAHELQDVIPLAVTGEKDAADADGNPVYQGVDYSKIVVHLVAAVQEQQAQIEELKARVAALEAK